MHHRQLDYLPIRHSDLALEDVPVLVGGLVLVMQHLDQTLVLDILFSVGESHQLPFFTSGLLVLPTLPLLVLSH